MRTLLILLIRSISQLRFVAQPRPKHLYGEPVLGSKMAWFIGLWVGGVIIVGCGAELLKMVIFGHSH